MPAMVLNVVLRLVPTKVNAAMPAGGYGKGVGVQEKWRNNPLHLRNYLTIRHPDGALMLLNLLSQLPLYQSGARLPDQLS